MVVVVTAAEIGTTACDCKEGVARPEEYIDYHHLSPGDMTPRGGADKKRIQQ